MKCAVFVILSCLCLYACGQSTQQYDQVWGNISARNVGSETIKVPSTVFQVKVHTLTFPTVPLAVPIVGIRHTDYKQNRVSVKFLEGGIGFKYAKIEITSQRGHGINSVFTFYTN